MTGRNVVGWIFMAAGAACIILARWKTRHMVEFEALIAMWYGYLCGIALLLGGLKMSTEKARR